MSQRHSTTIARILYIDDDSDDQLLLQKSFAEQASPKTSMVMAPGGEEAIRYLHSVPKEQLPSLIILDLNMPRWDGRRTLNYIKSQPPFAQIPVVILSTSSSKLDKEVCKRLGAATYLEKPFHVEGYKEVVSSCLSFIA